MHMMEQHSRAKFSRHRSHPIALLYGIPFFSLNIDLLKNTVAALPIPPVDEGSEGAIIICIIPSTSFCFLMVLV